MWLARWLRGKSIRDLPYNPSVIPVTHNEGQNANARNLFGWHMHSTCSLCKYMFSCGFSH